MVFIFGPLQAYGISMFMLVAAFRVAVREVDREGLLGAAAVGLLAGTAAASTLLSAAAVPVLILWMLYYNRAGGRWGKLAAFAMGAVVPFAPVAWLASKGPRQTWFNLVEYHTTFRKLYWPETTRHDLEVLTSWIDSGQALVLGLLAVAGLVYIARRSQLAGGAEGGILFVCVAGGGAVGGGGARASDVPAILCAGGSLPRDSGYGGIVCDRFAGIGS